MPKERKPELRRQPAELKAIKTIAHADSSSTPPTHYFTKLPEYMFQDQRYISRCNEWRY